MNIELTDDQQLLQRTVRDFAEAEVKPLAREIDETGRFPLGNIRKAGELGLTGVCVAEKYGGSAMDHVAYSIVIEEIARVCASTAVILSVQNSLYCASIETYGTEEQKQKFLVPYARGEKIGCYALTEPQVGSNAAALATKAVRKGDRYVVNGSKAWITNGGAADAGIIYVNTQPEKGEKGITALVVEKGTPGFVVGKEEKKLGIHATACAGLPSSIAKFRWPIASAKKGKDTKSRFRCSTVAESASVRKPPELRRARSKRRWRTRKSDRRSAIPSRSSRRFSSCWPIWPRTSKRRACWCAARRGGRIQARDFRWKRPPRNFSRARCPRA